VQQGLLAAHRRLLREGEVATTSVGGGKLQLLLFNDILQGTPPSPLDRCSSQQQQHNANNITIQSKLSKLGASKKAIADTKEFQWPLELVWLNEDSSQGSPLRSLARAPFRWREELTRASGRRQEEPVLL